MNGHLKLYDIPLLIYTVFDIIIYKCALHGWRNIFEIILKSKLTYCSYL